MFFCLQRQRTLILRNRIRLFLKSEKETLDLENFFVQILKQFPYIYIDLWLNSPSKLSDQKNSWLVTPSGFDCLIANFYQMKIRYGLARIELCPLPE